MKSQKYSILEKDTVTSKSKNEIWQDDSLSQLEPQWHVETKLIQQKEVAKDMVDNKL